jgi:3-phenylpropionate/trans-cinnamate dioxygenase ferredoxin subunit
VEWIKIFLNEKEARAVVKEHVPQLIIIDGKRICITLHEGKFFAVQDECTHAGESLSKGRINYRGEIVCPMHGYRFDLNGGSPCDSSCRDLATYPLKKDDNGFFIGI